MQFRTITGIIAICGVSLGAALAPGAAAADDMDNAHVEGIVIGTWQAASRSSVDGQDVNSEGNGQLYLLGSMDMGPGGWVLELRGSTTPRENGVTSFFASNASVGETTDADGNGRIAATQLFYELPVGPGQLRVGLLDPGAVLDGNEVNDDEYVKFLADSFVHNPTIGFPSFVLGAAYQGTVSEGLDYKLFVSSDSGLEDPDDPTYQNVFAIRESGKGAFTAAELDWRLQDYSLQAGVWYDTAHQSRLDRPSEEGRAYGFYAGLVGPAGPGLWAMRAGIANDEVQADANFLSLAYELPVQLGARDTTLGLAIARRGDSSHLPFDSEPIRQVEAYWRIHVAGSAYISPDIQYIDNAGFQDRSGVWVGGARVGVEF